MEKKAGKSLVTLLAEQRKSGNWRDAMDGYGNAAAGIGESSALMSAGTFMPSGLTRDLSALTNAYRGSWLAKKIIDMPAEDMTRNWYTLSTSMPKENLQELIELEAEHNVK